MAGNNGFVKVVSFDTMTNTDLPDHSFTLRAKSSGYKHSKQSRTFMVATDLENYSESALDWTINNMMEEGDELVVLRVVTIDMKSIKKNGILQLEEKLCKEKAEEIMQKIVESSYRWNKKVSVVIEFVIGKVQETIQRMIPIYQPSLLIVGTRGLSEFKGLISTSISKYCLQNCPVPVTVVRPEEQVRKSSFDSTNSPKRKSLVSIF